MDHPPAFFQQPGLNVETYDVRSAQLQGTPVEGDVDFFVNLARETGGPVLELGCGTGRVSFPLARSGIEVTGLDLSPHMLAVARGRLEGATAMVRGRLSFQQGDMTDFALGRRFPLAFAAFRAFQSLTSPEQQRSCLECVHRHLERDGRFVLDLFDPRLDLLAPERDDQTQLSYELEHPGTGNLVRTEVIGRENDHLNQLLHETWRWTEIDPDGGVLRTEEQVLTLRWTHRYEIRHLLELADFEVVAEYSDHSGSPPAYGRELLLVARPA